MGNVKSKIVKGVVILKLKEETSRAVTTSIPTGRRSSVINLGIASVDRILAEFGTIGITKLRGLTIENLPGGTRIRRENEPEVTHGTYGFTRTYRVKVPKETDLESMIKKLNEDPSVESVENDYFAYSDVVPNDGLYERQWGLKRIKCEEAWEHEKGNENVIIAIIDTGVEQNHPDLVDKLVPGYDMVDLTDVPPEDGCVWEGDIDTRDNNPEDDNGHGTHCAGIAAASNDNNLGVAGVAWKCKIMPIRVLANLRCGRDVSGSGTFTDIADGIIWAADHGVHVISMSLGGMVPKSVTPPSMLKDAIDYANSNGCVIVASMGNDGINLDEAEVYHYPSAHPEVLAVGAIDKNNKRANFSNYGSKCDHVMAPGVDIQSTYLRSNYASLNGTSMATPFVSGLAALIKSTDSHLNPKEIRKIICQTAESQSDNIQYGYGIIDAYKAINTGDDCKIMEPFEVTVKDNLKEKEDKCFKIKVPNKLINIYLDGPEGADFDLYLKKNAKPTTLDYDVRAFTLKSDETITYPIEEPGDYYVMVKSYQGQGDFKLKVTRE